MTPQQRSVMLGQTVPALHRGLVELEDRRRKRGNPAAAPRVENPVDAMRQPDAARGLRGT